MTNVLEVSNLTKVFGGLTAVDNLDLNVKKGTIHGLIGPNGAGKTTVINLLTGFYTPTSGSIHFNGQDILKLKSYERARLGMARTFQQSRLFGELTVMENVIMAMDYHSKYSLLDVLVRRKKVNQAEEEMRKRVMDTLIMLNMGEYHKMLTENLPYGQRRLVEIARAVVAEPDFLLLDEPSAGMNATERALLSKEIINLKNQGLSILIVEHHMEMIMNICDEITVISFGKRIAHGEPKDVQENPDVIEAYLGGDFVVED